MYNQQSETLFQLNIWFLWSRMIMSMWEKYGSMLQLLIFKLFPLLFHLQYQFHKSCNIFQLLYVCVCMCCCNWTCDNLLKFIVHIQRYQNNVIWFTGWKIRDFWLYFIDRHSRTFVHFAQNVYINICVCKENIKHNHKKALQWNYLLIFNSTNQNLLFGIFMIVLCVNMCVKKTKHKINLVYFIKIINTNVVCCFFWKFHQSENFK